MNIPKIVMRANHSKSSRLVFASHSSTGSTSGFSKGNLDLYVVKSKFNKSTSEVAQWENRPSDKAWFPLVVSLHFVAPFGFLFGFGFLLPGLVFQL